MAEITIGMPASDRSSFQNYRTIVNKGGVADGTGKITKVYIRAYADMTGCKVATFYRPDPGSYPNNLTTRDWEAIPGTITAGAEREFTVDLNVVAGDYIGIVIDGGTVEYDYSGGAGAWETSGGDLQIPCTNYTFISDADNEMSVRGTGATTADFEYIAQTGKWSGVEMCFQDVYDTANFDTYFDELIAAGFTQVRMHFADWAFPEDVDVTKTAALAAIAKGLDVVWGVSSGNTTLTSSNIAAWHTAMDGYATWAQANGIYEFCIGNELEVHNDDDTLTDSDVRDAVRALATSVQAIFTNGDVTYSNSLLFLADWISEGKGDIDSIGWFCYRDEGDPDLDYWMEAIDLIMAEWTAEEAYISEWNLDSGGYYYWNQKHPGLGEAGEAIGITEMIDYFKGAGLTRTFFFYYSNAPWMAEEDTFSVRKENGTYRLLWWSLLDSAGAILRFSGSATCVLGFTYTGSGSLTFSGTAVQEHSRDYVYTTDGTLTFSGAGVYVLGFSHTGTGTLLFSGSALAEKKYHYCTGAGSFNFSGEGVCYKEEVYNATGSFVYSGQAIQSYTWNYSCVAFGNFNLSGIGACLLGFSYVASGSLVFSGAGTYVFGVSYIGNGVGGFFFSGYADCSYETETENFIYAGQGEIHFSGDAVYSFTRFFIYSGEGTFLFSGEAVVQKFNFISIGSGILTYSGLARIVCHYNWIKSDKEKDDWTKVNKEKEDWIKVEK